MTKTLSRREFGRLSMAGVAAFAVPQERRDPPGIYRYVHLDVFTDQRLAGNQLLVFTQPTGLTTDAMQGLTRESNYSECTFVFPPEQAGTDYRVRIFTRTAETPFAGHPTIGTAFGLAHARVIKAGTAKTVFGLGVGPTDIDLEWNGVDLATAWMTQLKPTFGKTVDDGATIAQAIGVDTAAVRLKPDRVPAGQEVSCGSNFLSHERQGRRQRRRCRRRNDDALVSSLRSSLAFGRRCIPAGCVAHRSNISDMLTLRALPSGRLAALGALVCCA